MAFMKYRWMKKKDFDFLRNKVGTMQNFISIFSNKKIIANIVEQNDNITGWVVYKLHEENVKIIRLGFKNEEIFDFIIKKISSKKNVEIAISEYDSVMQSLLKNSGFFAANIIKSKDIYFYNFIKKLERL